LPLDYRSTAVFYIVFTPSRFRPSLPQEAEKLKEGRKQIAANYKPLHDELRSLKIEQVGV
jgi:hypothetical protein